MSAFKNKASSGGGDFTAAPAGSHPAVLVAMVDLGTHDDTYQGKVNTNRKLFLAWELTAEPDAATGENFIVGRDYTNSLNPKAAFRQIVEKWRGRAFTDGEEFDYSKLLGKPCLLTLVHKTSQGGNTYAKIDSVGPLPKGMKAAPATKAPLLWEIGDDMAKLPSWLPFVYGEAVTEVLKRSAELVNGGEPAPSGVGEPVEDMAEIF